MPSPSSCQRKSGAAMSNHARMAMPRLIVTGLTGACGNTWRTLRDASMSAAGSRS